MWHKEPKLRFTESDFTIFHCIIYPVEIKVRKSLRNVLEQSAKSYVSLAYDCVWPVNTVFPAIWWRTAALSSRRCSLFDEEQRHCHHVVGLFPAVTGKAALFLAGKCGGPKHRREFFVRYSALHTGEYVACYRLSDSGEDAKEKGTRKDRRAGSFLPRFTFVFALSQFSGPD